MQNRYFNKITLDNPYALSLLFITGGALGFFIYLWLLAGICYDNYFALTFISATIFTIFILVYWGSILENAKFEIQKFPVSFVIVIAVIKLYISFQVIQSGQVDDPDLRLQAYGNSTLIMLSGAAGILFFPIGYFASSSKFVKMVVLTTFIFTTLVGLLMGPSKSAIFSIGFTVLLFFFLKRKKTGEKFPFPLIGKFSLLLLSMLLIFQIALGVIFFGSSPLEFMALLVNRAMQNFDGAIYGCMLENNERAPNSFLTYSFLPVLKRLDQSFYALDYYNVPQWLLYEVFGISREGRFGYPNDNLYTALYFSGFKYFSPVVFLIISFCLQILIKKSATYWRRNGSASPIHLATIFSIPLAFVSFQEFVGLLLFYLIFKLVQILLQTFNKILLLSSRKIHRQC